MVQIIGLGFGNPLLSPWADKLLTLHDKQVDAIAFPGQGAAAAGPVCEQGVGCAAAKVGGIHANNSQPVEFLLDNLRIQNNVIQYAFEAGAKKLLFLGSSCIYPKLAEQPMTEDALRQTMVLFGNQPSLLLERPIALLFFVLTAFSIWRIVWLPTSFSLSA